MTNRVRLALLAAALASAGTARAETVRASSTTMIIGRQDVRDGNPQTAIPIYEIVDVSATDVRTSFADFEITLSTWGSADLGPNVRFWQNGADVHTRLTGDVNVGFVKASFLGNALQLRAGRQFVADGAARMIQLDGGELRLVLPAGFGLSGYVGAPVAPRFSSYGGESTVGNIGADLAYGGRVSWGYAGLLEVGGSVAMATDHGDPSRQDVGADFRVTPHRMIAFVGSGWWSLYEGRMGEGSIAAILTPIRHLDVKLDFRHVEPDLFLPRNSILAVFASDKRNDLGGSVSFAPLRWVALDADAHVLLEDAGTGFWGRAKGVAHPGKIDTTLGAEVSYLTHPDNSYVQGRLFGGYGFAPLPLNATIDLIGTFFEHQVNGASQALTGTATLGYRIARGWRALVAGTAGSTAFLSSQFEVMAKLVYDQTYIATEVR